MEAQMACPDTLPLSLALIVFGCSITLLAVAVLLRLMDRGE
jgi:hypothetical protein